MFKYNFISIKFLLILFFAISFTLSIIAIFYIKQYKNLENQIDILEKNFLKLNSEFMKLSLENFENYIKEIEEKESSMFVEVSTEEKGYSILKTDYGSFVISFEELVPFLDGYKIFILVGNLTNAKFSGAEVIVKWGKEKISNGVLVNKRNFEYEKSFSVTNYFYPAKYNKIELVLTPATPQDIKRIVIGIRFNRLTLSY